jgi:YD repeat-containing protein
VTTFPFIQPVGDGYSMPVVTLPAIPPEFMTTLRIQAGANLDHLFYVPALGGRKLAIVLTGGQAQLWRDDTLIAAENGGSGGLTITETYHDTVGSSWNFSNSTLAPTTAYDYVVTSSANRDAIAYALPYSFEPSERLLRKREAKLMEYRRTLANADTTRQVITETLNVLGLSWMFEKSRADEIIAQQANMIHERECWGGLAGQNNPQNNSYYVDMGMEIDAYYSRAGNTSAELARENNVFDVAQYFGSPLEHGVIEQMQGGEAISTTKILKLNNANHLQTQRTVDSGGEVTLAPPAGTQITLGGWTGSGFYVLYPNGDSSQIITSPTILNGGANTTKGLVNPKILNFVLVNSPTMFNPQGLSAPSVAAEPVNMADGSFLLNAEDLTLGLPEPQGIRFVRHYNSNRNNENSAFMTYGWTHNYNIYGFDRSSPEAALGSNTPEEMAVWLVATKAALDVYSRVNGTAREWLTTALIANWATDQLKNNAVAITLGSDVVQFIRQPNGTYTAPAGVNATLTKPAGYQLQFRHGNTLTFDPTTEKLNTITDARGQVMALTYNLDGSLASVADSWPGTAKRMLTFITPQQLQLHWTLYLTARGAMSNSDTRQTWKISWIS